MKLLIKIKKISEIEYDVMEGFINKPEDYKILCQVCKENESNCFIHPFSHVCICCDCTLKVSNALFFINLLNFMIQIFLPNIK